ncbi:MAG: hypothetical protein FWD69_15195 [Polyangiaceae bacterium]|nr:hypothetical protein [Polyangiaceae bacterium]
MFDSLLREIDSSSMAPSALSARLRRDLRWALRCLRTYEKYAFAGFSRSALASIRSRRLSNML